MQTLLDTEFVIILKDDLDNVEIRKQCIDLYENIRSHIVREYTNLNVCFLVEDGCITIYTDSVIITLEHPENFDFEVMRVIIDYEDKYGLINTIAFVDKSDFIYFMDNNAKLVDENLKARRLVQSDGWKDPTIGGIYNSWIPPIKYNW